MVPTVVGLAYQKTKPLTSSDFFEEYEKSLKKYTEIYVSKIPTYQNAAYQSLRFGAQLRTLPLKDIKLIKSNISKDETSNSVFNQFEWRTQKVS